MTARRAWALVAVAAAGLALTPWAGLAASLVAVAALAALTGLSALSARDTVREARLAALEAGLRETRLSVADTEKRTAEMWRVYQAGA